MIEIRNDKKFIFFSQYGKQELVFMYKMRTSRKIPNRKNHAIPKLFPESPPVQAWGRTVVATVEAWLLRRESTELRRYCCPPSRCLPHRLLPLCDEGILNIIGKNFCLTRFCSVFKWGEPHYFVLGPCESSWPGRIVRAKSCDDTSSANPPCIALWEMVLVNGFLWPSDPLKTLWWGTVVMLPFLVQLGLQPITAPMDGHLSGCIRMDKTRERTHGSNVFNFIVCHLSSSDLPVTTSYPHCNAWAYLRAWQRPPAGSYPVTQQSLFGCVDGSCAVPFAHIALEKVPALLCVARSIGVASDVLEK